MHFALMLHKIVVITNLSYALTVIVFQIQIVNAVVLHKFGVLIQINALHLQTTVAHRMHQHLYFVI